MSASDKTRSDAGDAIFWSQPAFESESGLFRSWYLSIKKKCKRRKLPEPWFIWLHQLCRHAIARSDVDCECLPQMIVGVLVVRPGASYNTWNPLDSPWLSIMCMWTLSNLLATKRIRYTNASCPGGLKNIWKHHLTKFGMRMQLVGWRNTRQDCGSPLHRSKSDDKQSWNVSESEMSKARLVSVNSRGIWLKMMLDKT